MTGDSPRAWAKGTRLEGARERRGRPAAPGARGAGAGGGAGPLGEPGRTSPKTAQTLSTRPDLIPPEAVAELAALQDRVTPLDEPEVVGGMEQELGVPWEHVLASIQSVPL